ncbi:MAG: AMP-binding protein [Actinomycetota bacterium]
MDADPQPIPASLEYWAARTPDAPAVVHGDRVLTYGSWNDAADRLADALARLGVETGDRLGMRFRLRPEWFVAQRALGKLGAQLVAVNWRLTPDEAAYILSDSGSRGLVCDDEDVTGWDRLGLDLLVTVGQGPGTAGYRLEDLVVDDGPAPTRRYGPVKPGLVVYTSGTTGYPKGVPPGPTVHDLTPPDPETLEVGDDGRGRTATTTLLTLPIHHAAGPALAVAACTAGGTIVLHDPFDPAEVLRLIEQHRVAAWTAVPTMLLRVRALPPEVVAANDLSSLGYLGLGAAAVPFELKRWAVSVFGDDCLWEGYGSTEAGMISQISPADQLRKPGSSGRPYPHVTVRILDDDWNSLPAGSTGEIAVKSPTVSTEYLGQGPMGPDVLRDGFYRTGDVGHLDDDGFLFITDRVKDMIVAGGSNIYPAEIEKALIEHPAVVDAAVIGIPHEEFGEEVLAFVVAGGEERPGTEELTRFLGPRLARYKLPRRYELVDELPLNPMGKVMKNELRAPYWTERDRKV